MQYKPFCVLWPLKYPPPFPQKYASKKKKNDVRLSPEKSFWNEDFPKDHSYNFLDFATAYVRK